MTWGFQDYVYTFCSLKLSMLVLILLLPFQLNASRPFKIVWFTNLYKVPDTSDNPFWNLSKRFISAAAADLGVELDIEYTEQNYIYLISRAEEIMKNPGFEYHRQ